MPDVDTTMATPPTEPDESRVEKPRVTSPLAIASLGFGATGLILPLCGIVAIVLGVMAVRRIPRLGQEGRGLAYTGISIGAVGILVTALYVAMVWSMASAIGQTSRLIMNSKQTKVRGQAIGYAQTHQGKYPAHMGELTLSGVGNRVWSVVMAGESSSMVGDIDLAEFVDNEEGRTALAAAIEATDTTTPFYTIGDMWFARLTRPTYDGAIVFSWTVDDEIGDVFFQMDDGMLDVVDTPEEWDAIWIEDGKTRPKHGLKLVEAPAMPEALNDGE